MPPENEPLTDIIEKLTAFAASSLLASDNEFFVLHDLTSLHGVLCLLPHLDPADRRGALVHWWREAISSVLCSRDEHVPKATYVLRRWSAWGAFRPASEDLLQRAARNIVAPNESGEIHENLWFAKSFSKASEEKERAYD